MRKFIFSSLLIIITISSFAQCNPNRLFQGYFIFSPGISRHVNNGTGVLMEMGIAFPSSPFAITLKGDCWIQHATFYDSVKSKSFNLQRPGIFTGIKLYYTPQAYKDVTKKWMFGAAPGIYINEGEDKLAGLETSAAYTIFLNGSNARGDQGGYFRAEIGTMSTIKFVRPYVSLSIMVLI